MFFCPSELFAMDRFVSRRSSSSVDLDASSRDDVRAERAAIALSVGLSWPPDRYAKARRGRRSRQELWERALQEHILEHHELPHGIKLQRPAWWRPGEAIDRPLTHVELAHIKLPCAAAAPVEDEPSGSASKRRKIHVDSIARDWFLDMVDQWKTERRWDMRRCLREVQRLCPELFAGIDKNTPYRWKRSSPRAETRGRRSMLTPADTTRLSEHIMQVTDVLCLSAVTIHGLVLEWLDAEGLGVRPSCRWVTRLLRGMRLSFKKPARCLRELHSPEQKHANTHRMFVKLCWLMEKHAVGADRVVNIDETSCRLLPVHQTGWDHRGVKQAQLQGNTKEATTFTIAFSMDRGPLDWCRSCTRARQTPFCPSSPGRSAPTTSSQTTAGPRPPRSCSSRPPWITCSIQAKRGNRGSSSGDMASIHASEATLEAMRATFPHVVLCFPPATQHVVPAALRRGRLPRAASKGKRAPLLPAPFSMAPSTAWP